MSSMTLSFGPDSECASAAPFEQISAKFENNLFFVKYVYLITHEYLQFVIYIKVV